MGQDVENGRYRFFDYLTKLFEYFVYFDRRWLNICCFLCCRKRKLAGYERIQVHRGDLHGKHGKRYYNVLGNIWMTKNCIKTKRFGLFIINI